MDDLQYFRRTGIDRTPSSRINVKKHIYGDRVLLEIEFISDMPPGAKLVSVKELNEHAQAFLEEVHLVDGSPDDPPTIDHRRRPNAT